MRILIIHNKYQCPGGEDAVVESEGALLAQNGHVVDYLIFDNAIIQTRLDQWIAGISNLYNFNSARLLQSKIFAFKPDLIHVHNFVPLVSPAVFFVAKRFRIPVVATLHNYRLICPSATLFFDHQIYEKSIQSLFPIHSILKGVYRKSRLQTAAIAIMTCFHNLAGTWKNKIDKYIVLTEFASEKFKQSALRVPEKKFFVKPNFVPDYGDGKLQRDDFFLFVGRLSEEKGIEMLLKTASRYHFNLTIIGDGPLKHMVLEYARNYSNISYMGYQHKVSVIHQMKRCTALIFPSLWYEGFPIAILEAFSTGTPVIVSGLGGLPDIVQNNVNGLNFKPGDQQDLLYMVMLLLDDPKLRAQLGSNARYTYLTRYTPQINYELLLKIYQEAITDSKAFDEIASGKLVVDSRNIYPNAANIS